MPEKKKQHYIPKTLLKRFSNAKKCYLYNLKENEIIEKPVPYDNQCYTDYMYGNDLSIEDELGKIESAFSTALTSIIASNHLPTEPEQIKILSGYIVLQWLRTEGSIDMVENSIKSIVQSIIKNIALAHGANNDADVKTFSEEYVSAHFSRQKIAIQNSGISQNENMHIDDLTLCLLNNATNLELVLSDDPIIVGNDFQPKYGLGVRSAGIYFLMPISPLHVLLLYDSKMYAKEKNKLDLTDVQHINNMQFTNARQIVIARNKQPLDELKQKYNGFICLRETYPTILNSIIKVNDSFAPYRGIIDKLFIRADMKEYGIKHENWGEEFSKLVYDTYMSK